jgi:hypothetical protein
VGEQVRVKTGTCDPDFPDFPLGGWSGTIREIDVASRPPVYLILWNDYTLKHLHPIYRQRCERDGLECDSMWLGEDDLQPAAGDLGPLEQPTAIVPRPLQPHDQEDRIRAILGLTSDDPLPEVSRGALGKYHTYLSKELSFPFNAEVWVQSGPFQGRTQPITVYRLLPPDEGRNSSGLLVEAGRGQEQVVLPLGTIETGGDSPVRRPLQDYAYWFWNWRNGSGPRMTREPPEDESAADPGTMWKALLRFAVYGMGLGASLGAILATLDEAIYGLYIGAALLGLLGYLAGMRYGLVFGSINRLKGGPLFGGILGALAGAVAGGGLGVLVVACLGTVAGSILGNLLGHGVARLGFRPFGDLIWALLGACTGGLLLALYINYEKALTGALAGALLCGVLTALVFLCVVVALGLMIGSKE